MKESEAFVVLVLGMAFSVAAMAGLLYPVVQQITNAIVAF